LSAEPALQITGLEKSFGRRRVLSGIDLRVDAGEIVAILGANGSGKSTALRCVVGLAQADAGEIRVSGRDLTRLSGTELLRARRQAAMVFQQIHLVRRRTALANVCSGALGRLPLNKSAFPLLFPNELREEAMACLDRVGLADRAHDRVSALSGGQQQRVAVARALCQRASILLADEPVAALDPAASEQVLSLLAELARRHGLAVAAVLHQPDLARRHADRIVGVLDGRVVFDRPPTAISSTEIDRLYGVAQLAVA
jgi:phosphonate transport system ATP-binding protein